jgi:hypothetical protein
MDLYIHSPIRLHEVVLNSLNTGTTLLLLLLLLLLFCFCLFRFFFRSHAHYETGLRAVKFARK